MSAAPVGEPNYRYARDTAGHAAAPSAAMNSRRRICHASEPLYGQAIAALDAWEPAGHRPGQFSVASRT
jgi:hypothetical protein